MVLAEIVASGPPSIMAAPKLPQLRARAISMAATWSMAEPMTAAEVLIADLTTVEEATTETIVRPQRAIPTTRPPIPDWSKSTNRNLTKCSASRTPSAKKCSGAATKNNKD